MSDKRREVGQRLRAERERLGYDLDALEMKTKIRKRYLGALEDGDWDVLPGDVYARGFIRSYAEAVSLNGRELLGALDEDPYGVEPKVDASRPKSVTTSVPVAQQETEAAGGAPTAKTRNVSNKPSRSPKPVKVKEGGRSVGANVGQATLVVGMLAVLGVGWYFVHRWSGGHTDTGAQNILTTGNTPTQGNSTGANRTANQVGNNPANAVTTPTSSNSTSNSVGGAATNPATVQIVQQPGASSSNVNYSVVTKDPLSVQVTPTNGPCWVSVSGDNRTIDGSDTIPANQSKTWPANQSMTIYFGHLTGVTVTVNGQPVVLPTINNPAHVTFTKKTQTP